MTAEDLLGIVANPQDEGRYAVRTAATAPAAPGDGPARQGAAWQAHIASLLAGGVEETFVFFPAASAESTTRRNL